MGRRIYYSCRRGALGVALALVLLSTPARAHLVSSKDSTVVWSTQRPQEGRLHFNRSLRSWLAVGASHDRIEQPEGTAQLAYGQANFLVRRWNRPGSQANLYATGGLGAGRLDDGTRLAWQGSLTADWETRDEFLMVMAEHVRLQGARSFNHLMARAGLAPYRAEYDELQAWLMVDAEWRPYFRSERFMVTPLLRFFYRNVLWEMGSSLRGSWMLNLMVHF